MCIPIPLNNRKSQIRKICLESYYPQDYLEPEQLDYFKLLFWSGSYLSEQLKIGADKNRGFAHIIRDGISFVPVFIHCTSMQAQKAGQVKISFRRPADHTICPAYALVKIHL